MGAMTPARYAERYLNLEVGFDDGPVIVKIGKYHIGEPDAEKDVLLGGVRDHFQTKQKKDPGYKLRLTVNATPVEFSSLNEMQRRIVNPFWGKGSPEDCQIVLQVAVLVGRATTSTVQTYADTHLGLDCNGFVGNYIFRVLRGNGWRTDAADDVVGPSSTITAIMAGGLVIRSVDDLVVGRSYVLGEVDGANRIIAGGPTTAAGHIVITEPGRFVSDFMSMNLDLADKGVLGNPAFWAVESTGGVGLTQSWYVVQQLKNGSRPVDGVFRIYRSSKRAFLNFRMIALV
jgi:hypothetical protein